MTVVAGADAMTPRQIDRYPAQSLRRVDLCGRPVPVVVWIDRTNAELDPGVAYTMFLAPDGWDHVLVPGRDVVAITGAQR